jgi:SAM-dependent methyltransferase
LKKHILPHLKVGERERVSILDIGAGNGWLSYRLTQMGFHAVAVDLLVNEQDGLGAAKHYERHLQELFPRFQAESAKLPFAEGQFDAIVFNASFHYAENYTTCLREALRCLKGGGMIVVADSPWYARQSSGERMLDERRAFFLNRFCTFSNSISSLEFLTDERLRELEQAFGIQWERHAPFYGIRWAFRPLIARLRRRREPAVFRIYTARKIA